MPSTIDVYNKIIDFDNIRQAYFDLVGKFDLAQKTKRYYGIDGVKLNDLNFISEDILKEIHDEMISFIEITPAYMIAIPKKNNGKRNIYVYSIKERIKAEAIYRVLEPIFDEYLSKYLFSYRKSHPSYFAARSAVRRYKRYFGQNHILVADLSDYTDSMDHEILFKKISILNLDKKTEKLLKLFISAKKIEYGLSKNNDKGLMTGTPLSGLLSNLFMDDFDKWAGKYVDFYRRVGDDMIAMDKDPVKINKVYERLLEIVEYTKLKLNVKKVRLIDDRTKFEFLGYKFENGKISFSPSSLNRTISNWKTQLMRYPGSNIKRKIRWLKIIFHSEQNNLSNQFDNIIKQKILVDDQKQVKDFSDKFYKILTTYFFGYYSEKNRRKLSYLLKDNHISSLFKHFNDIHFPKTYGKQ
jgi:RNA-directed DNA polymerase